MNTHRAHMGSTTTLTCWVRDEAGKRDLAGKALTVPVYAYGMGVPLLTLDATQVATGQVAFDITQPATERYFERGLYRFTVKADDEVAYSGLLELV